RAAGGRLRPRGVVVGRRGEAPLRRPEGPGPQSFLGKVGAVDLDARPLAPWGDEVSPPRLATLPGAGFSQEQQGALARRGLCQLQPPVGPGKVLPRTGGLGPWLAREGLLRWRGLQRLAHGLDKDLVLV